MFLSGLRLSHHRRGQITERMSENGIDQLARLWRSPLIYAEKIRPVYNPVMWYRAGAGKIWEDLPFCAAVIERID